MLPQIGCAAAAWICVAADRAIADGAWLDQSHVNGSITYRVQDEQYWDIDWSIESFGDDHGVDWQWDGQDAYGGFGLAASGNAFTGIDMMPGSGIGGSFTGFDFHSANVLTLQFDGTSPSFNCYTASAADCWFTVDTPMSWTWTADVRAQGTDPTMNGGDYWFQLARAADETIIAEDWRDTVFHENVQLAGLLEPGTYRVIAYSDTFMSYNDVAQGTSRTTTSASFRLTEIPAPWTVIGMAILPMLRRRSSRPL